jgi:formylglycine-generating enzyme required for sulfatase activity
MGSTFRNLPLLAIVLAPVACDRESTVPPDLAATQVPVRKAEASTLTAGVLNATSMPSGSGTPIVVETWTRPGDGSVMVRIPPGEFSMGSSDEDIDAVLAEWDSIPHDRSWFGDEQPQHTVYLDSYWIDQTEVTRSQYFACVNMGQCSLRLWCDPSGYPPSVRGPVDEHPIVCVTAYEAETYCRWVGARLPTEAEWEKAARGTDGRRYPWRGEFDCRKGNFKDEVDSAGLHRDWVVPGGPDCDGFGGTAPVGSFPTGASPYGVLDMEGNAMEWVADGFETDFYGASHSRNPQGPDVEWGHDRVVRGSSFSDVPRPAHSANRSFFSPISRGSVVGFRCAMSSAPTP